MIQVVDQNQSKELLDYYDKKWLLKSEDGIFTNAARLIMSGQWHSTDVDFLLKHYAPVIIRYRPIRTLDPKPIMRIFNIPLLFLLARYNKNIVTYDKNLLVQRCNDYHENTLAHYFARYNHNWQTNDEEILKFYNRYFITVAHNLAYHHPTWATDNIDILTMLDASHNTVASNLYRKGKLKEYEELLEILEIYKDEDKEIKKYYVLYSFAKTGKWKTNKRSVLLKRSFYNRTIAHVLAIYNKKWTTQDREILLQQDYFRKTVAGVLITYNYNWVTNDYKVLMQYNEKEGYIYKRLLSRPNCCFYNINILSAEFCNGNTVTIRDNLKLRKRYFATQCKKNVLAIIPII